MPKGDGLLNHDLLPGDKGPQDACGVFGVWAPGEEVAKLTYFGLYALQHRGQESAGIAVSDGNGVDLCAVAVEGVFELPKATGVVINQGKKAYFISADKTVTGVASGNTLIGYVWETADAANPVVRVKIG